VSEAIRFPRFGNYGRFGNQLFQYAYCRAVADRGDSRLELPPWVGDVLFPNARRDDITDRPAAEICSYCQDPGHLALYTREQVREWFTLADEFRMPKIRERYVACNYRGGDYRDRPDLYAVVSRGSIEREAVSRGYDPEDVEWVTDEAQHRPTVAWPETEWGLEFLADWQILLDAPVLFRANSTFSWWAAELGEHEEVFSPVIGDRSGPGDYPFSRGNQWPLARGHHPLRIRPC